MDNEKKVEINSGEYWEERFASGDWDKNEGREQSIFFYEVAVKNFPHWLGEDAKKNCLSVCDLGCAEGEGAEVLGKYFENSHITGTDISEAALEIARKRYPKHSFVKDDVNNFKSEYDIIFSSNTLEHFENGGELLKKLMKNSRKYFVVLLPFREFERIDEHFYTFDYKTFSLINEDFSLVFFKEIDCTYMEGTQWPGKEILVIYQKKGTEGIEERTLEDVGEGLFDSLNIAQNNLEKLEEKLKETKKALEEEKGRTIQLEERIEADRNAIMQIQFEAHQHKQEELDLHETYVWRTGLKIEKILQKTGISFVRSLLEISDYKRMGLFLTLRKGFNEAFNRENVSKKKRRKLRLCRAKFNRYKEEREKAMGGLLQNIDVPLKRGLVSVVLPVFNGERVLESSIKSVLSQSYNNIELIIVNDGSTDSSLEIAKRYAQSDSRVRVISQSNKKLPTALSVGFRAAKGEFFTWTSADNIMLSDCVKTLVENLQRKPHTAMVYGNMRLINSKGKIKRGHFWFEKPLFSGNVCLPKSAESLNTYANNTIGAAFMYRKSAAFLLEDYSKYKTNLEDYDYWMRMNSLLKIEHIDEEKPIYLYRIHDESLTAHDKELGITKNRYKLMVLDDFRRDFYMSVLVWVIETEDENNPHYIEFADAARKAGHMILSREEAESISAPEKYSCFCYAYFGKGENSSKDSISVNFSGSVLVCDEPCEADGFDILVTCNSNAELPEKEDYRGWFRAKDGKTVFDLADTKIKNKILYSLEKMIDDPDSYEKKMSIIICTYMRGEKLIDAIWSVIRQSMSKKEYEIIIVDNAPMTSGIRETVEDFKNKYKDIDGFIRYIGVPQKGLSYARNGGMWNAKGEYLLFLDDDILADYYLLEEIFTGFKYHPNVGIVGGQVILERPFPTPKVLRKGWESLWSQFKISGNSFREVTQQFEFPYGADYGVRRSAIWRVGGFRMCYGRVGNDFAGGEETALAFKMLDIGYGIGLQPRAKVLHRVDISRFTHEHVKKTIRAGVLTTYRFFCDLHTDIGWTRRYAKSQIRITKKEISILTKKKADRLDIFYKESYLEAWKNLLEYIEKTESGR
ncbi:MAG: glycosyltransferase [Clostridia bacterium]|nr:glycosyltransferase [Clostridia bacterium]